MKNENKAIFVAATGQNVGKTTVCLGLIALIRKELGSVGFIKPVGQVHAKIDDILVDKDAILFKETFALQDHYSDMSCVIVPKGFTRDYLDQKCSLTLMKKKIKDSFYKISTNNKFTLVEGTGHVAVGSIIDLSNATVAKLLGLSVILITNGGLGSSFDELALNKAVLEKMRIPIKGIIINKVQHEKKEMIEHYFKKALAKWNIPLLGVLPFDPFLSTPTMNDFASLFSTTLLSGEELGNKQFEKIRLVATSVETFLDLTVPNQLIVTPATREDVVLALIRKKLSNHGLILTGTRPPSKLLLHELEKAPLPSLYAPFSSFDAMRMISSFTAKIRKEDKEKINHAISLVQKQINLDFL